MPDLWTKREIDKSLAFRVEGDETIAYEICNGCQRSWHRCDRKLGYGSGAGLCASCAGINQAESKRSLSDVILDALGNDGLSKKGILDATKASWREVDAALQFLRSRGEIELRGSRWHRGRHGGEEEYR